MRAIALLVLMGFAFIVLSGFSINGAVPGSTAAMTAIAVGSTTPVAVATCSTSGSCRRKAIEFDVIGSNTCYGAPAPQASPCSAASPAPNSTTMAGHPIVGPGSWTYRADKDINPSDPAVCAEWDWVCTGANNISHSDIP